MLHVALTCPVLCSSASGGPFQPFRRNSHPLVTEGCFNGRDSCNGRRVGVAVSPTCDESPLCCLSLLICLPGVSNSEALGILRMLPACVLLLAEFPKNP